MADAGRRAEDVASLSAEPPLTFNSERGTPERSGLVEAAVASDGPSRSPVAAKDVRRKRIGIIELLTDMRSSGWVERGYASVLTKQFASITPQAVSIWCRQMGHRVHYTTYYGQADPRSLLPDDLDVLFVSAYTRSSGIAYALAKLFGNGRTRTVIGGPHAKAYPADCLRR